MEVLSNLIVPKLSKELYRDRFMAIGDSIFMATLKLSELSLTPGGKNVYELKFEKVNIDFDNIKRENKDLTIHSLITYMERRQQLTELENAIKRELTIPRRASRWLRRGENIFIVSIMGIIAITIVTLAILPLLNVNNPISAVSTTPTIIPTPIPTYAPPPPHTPGENNYSRFA